MFKLKRNEPMNVFKNSMSEIFIIDLFVILLVCAYTSCAHECEETPTKNLRSSKMPHKVMIGFWYYTNIQRNSDQQSEDYHQQFRFTRKSSNLPSR